MKIVAHVWLTFMLANIVPIGHLSDLKAPCYNMLYSIIQDDHIVDVARIILEELQRFVDLEDNQSRDKEKGSLGFLTLVTASC